MPPGPRAAKGGFGPVWLGQRFGPLALGFQRARPAQRRGDGGGQQVKE
ncbi:hypothetical protein [Hymenobacter sp. UV11]|nr:hypothetical protein [Hymenobacter sp. UV11]